MRRLLQRRGLLPSAGPRGEELTIVPLRRAEPRRAARLLARVFAADPVLSACLGGGRRGALARRLFFSEILAAERAAGHVYAARGRGGLAGVAVWRPPGDGQARAPTRLRDRVVGAALRGLCPGGARRLSQGFAAAAALHPAEPHWYLAFVGVEPNLQRAGVGTLLLAPVLALADRDRVPCYLETPFPGTHGFYRRLGFQLVAEIAPFPRAPSVSVMLRAPGTTGS